MSKINRRDFARLSVTGAAFQALGAAQPGTSSDLMPGVWGLRFGKPETHTPSTTRHYMPAREALAKLPAATPPFPLDKIEAAGTRRGMLVRVPLEPNEMIYGLGLQLQSFMQRGLKKKLRVNADPKIDSGDSHAPVPFYVTTRGYGILVDTARYATFYCGNKKKLPNLVGPSMLGQGAAPAEKRAAVVSPLPEAYGRFRVNEPSEVLIEIPEAQGVDVYVFGGPTLRDAVSRYNLFSGGGALPPRWGLGFWYRCYGQFNQQQVLAMGADLRASQIPCDVLGLEPGWQTHAYSCSYVWSAKFPKPEAMLDQLRDSNYHVNLWEHAFVHPTSPIYGSLAPHAGDYEVWDGLVPDFLVSDARRSFADFHEKEHVMRGVDGYKLDECDNSDYTGNWSFPETARFPSGVDGEQMHCLFGLRYQDTIQSIFEQRRQRTFGLVRSSHAGAAPYPYALYSDLYDHREFIRGVANAGFSGLLWCPEVRDARNAEDLLRRLQTTVFSPLAMVNAWYIQNPPWKQVNREANNAGRFAEDWKQTEAMCRDIIQWRMRLLPYFYAAYIKYHETGLPPFRALVMDYPDDPNTWTIDNQYMAGESLLVAPMVAGESRRDVYLPEGDWYDFWTGEKLSGKRTMPVTAAVDRIPVYVKANTLLPLAEGGLHADDPRCWQIRVRAYGDAPRPATLIEDAGDIESSFTYVSLRWDAGQPQGTVQRTLPAQRQQYEVVGWERAVV